MDMWGFPNTYTMGKHLAEKMVMQFYAAGMPIAILRPSVVHGEADSATNATCISQRHALSHVKPQQGVIAQAARQCPELKYTR